MLLVSLKLTVRATFTALKLQISFVRTHDKTQMNAHTGEIKFSDIELFQFNQHCTCSWIRLRFCLYT